MAKPNIETERLILRNIQKEDVQEIFDCWMQDEEVSRYMWWKASDDIRDAEEFVSFELSQKDNPKWNRWLITKKESGEIIGTCLVFFNEEEETPHWDISYNLGRKYWGYGYVTEAMRCVMTYAQEHLGMKECITTYARVNMQSARVLHKLGFVDVASVPYVCSGGEMHTEGVMCRFVAWEKTTGRNILYIHGKGGSAEEAQHYAPLFPMDTVTGLDYQSETPRQAQKEFLRLVEPLQKEGKPLVLIANSIGAFFAMQALGKIAFEKAYFISPIVNMEKLISDMMLWAGVTEEQLAQQKTIDTSFGEKLSWEYLAWVREHPVSWKIPTSILCGSEDHLQSFATVKEFATSIGATLTVMEGGEHWFHTDEQMAFLDAWIQKEKNNGEK